MTEDGKFVSVPDFRANAREEDYEELWNLYQQGTRNFPKKGERSPDSRFQFSASAAKVLLDDWQQRRGTDIRGNNLGVQEGVPVGGLISSMPLKISEVKLDFEKHSLLLTEEHWQRLQAVFDRYPTRGKNYVLHAVMERALAGLDV